MNSELFIIDFESSKSKRYYQLYERITRLIKDGSLSEGEKLPSIRVLSEKLGISKNTVTKSYSLLETNGFLHSEDKKGYFVTHSEKSAPKKSPSKPRGKDDSDDSVPTVEAILRMRGNSIPDFSPAEEQEKPVIRIEDAATGEHNPKENPVPVKTQDDTEHPLLHSFRKILSAHSLIFPPSPFGLSSLRKEISSLVSRQFSISTEPEQIIVGNSQLHLLWMTLQIRSLSSPCRKSDGMGLLRLASQLTDGSVQTIQPRVAFNGDCPSAVKKIFSSKNIPSVTLTASDLPSKISQASDGQATVFFTRSSEHPSAYSSQLLSWSKSRSYRSVIEFDDLAPSSRETRLKSKDIDDTVIYIGRLCPSTPVEAAFAVLPKDICADYQQHYDMLDCTLPLLNQLAIADFIGKGSADV
ncbi:MAG TPA: hypothetical protein DEO40_08630 [Treponema sp.]|nr:hypothetical protein [Treponema sp.]